MLVASFLGTVEAIFRAALKETGAASVFLGRHKGEMIFSHPLPSNISELFQKCNVLTHPVTKDPQRDFQGVEAAIQRLELTYTTTIKELLHFAVSVFHDCPPEIQQQLIN